MIFCIAGKNEIAIYGVELLLKNGVSQDQIFCCINANDDGIDSWQPSFLKYAKFKNLRIVQLSDIYRIEDLAFISLEFDKIVKPSNFFSKNLYNIHFSLLPSYKGMYTSIMPIVNGESKSGVTLHYIDSGIDTGDIIDQMSFDIGLSETGLDLYYSYLTFAKLLLKRNINALINSTTSSSEQPSLYSSYYSKNQIDFDDIRINFRKTAFEIHNFIRAFTFRPYQLVKTEIGVISHTFLTNSRSTNKLGTFTKISDREFTLSTIDYDLEIYLDALEEILAACERDDINLIEKMYSLGYNLNEKNLKGWNPIIVSTYFESRKVFDFLVNLGIDINSYNNNGTSVFMYAMTKACETSETYFINRLISLGADLSHLDNKGFDVYYYCKKLSNEKIFDFINK